MALWRRTPKDPTAATIIVVSLAGREDLLPDFPYPLTEEASTIGRHDSCTIQVVDGEISRQHLTIRRDATGEYYAGDMASANGTKINGNVIRSEVRLHEGDRIEIGNSRLIFTRKRFKTHGDAIQHFRQKGQHIHGTVVQRPDEA